MTNYAQVKQLLSGVELEMTTIRTWGSEVLPVLKQLVTEADPLIARRAIYVAGVIGGDEGLALLERAAQHDDVHWRLAAASGAGEHENGAPIILQLLEDRDEQVRLVAIKAMQGADSTIVRERIASLATTDPSGVVRDVAASRVGYNGTARQDHYYP